MPELYLCAKGGSGSPRWQNLFRMIACCVLNHLKFIYQPKRVLFHPEKVSLLLDYEAPVGFLIKQPPKNDVTMWCKFVPRATVAPEDGGYRDTAQRPPSCRPGSGIRACWRSVPDDRCLKKWSLHIVKEVHCMWYDFKFTWQLSSCKTWLNNKPFLIY